MVKHKYSFNPLNKLSGATLLYVTWNKGYNIIPVRRETMEVMAE